MFPFTSMVFADSEEVIEQPDEHWNMSIGTLERINASLLIVVNNYRIKNFKGVYDELLNTLQELTAFINKISKEGKLEKKPEMTYAEEIIKRIEEESKQCSLPQEDGNFLFTPTYKFIELVKGLDTYLRTVMYKYGLYMDRKQGSMWS